MEDTKSLEDKQIMNDNNQQLEKYEKYQVISKIFIETMHMLDEVNNQHCSQIVKIAEAAAQSAIKLSKDAKEDIPSEKMVDIEAEKNGAEKIVNKSRNTIAELITSTETNVSQDPKLPSFENNAIANFNLAFQNAVASQQALNEIAISVVGKSVNFVHSAVSHALKLPEKAGEELQNNNPRRTRKPQNEESNGK